MTHAEAEALGAVEKYLLNELSPDQRDAFEEHYFTCGQCASELGALSTTVEAIRNGALSTAVRQPARKAWTWAGQPLLAKLSYFCTVSLAGVVFYQSAVTVHTLRAELERPQFIEKLTPNVQPRGPRTAAQSYGMPLAFQPGFASYRIDFTNESGQLLQQRSITAAEAERTEALIWPGRLQVHGKLQVQVYGLNAGFDPQPLNSVAFYIP